jgi:hypothetical protein
VVRISVFRRYIFLSLRLIHSCILADYWCRLHWCSDCS